MPPQAPDASAEVKEVMKEGMKEELERSRQLVCLQEDIIGNYDKFVGPFGDRPIIYADWTASGKCIHSIENFMANSVLPLYGNTHTEVSVSGHQTGLYRDESRDIISRAMNATDLDAVIFTGNGTTGAFLKLIQSLRLEVTGPTLFNRANIPVVFTSSYEHHSNILNWRESVADVVTVKYSPVTGVDLPDLTRLLALYSNRKRKIGSFSAASNVSGILTSTHEVAAVMHRAGGLAFFDYATAGPYVMMDMNPVVSGPDAAFVYKDGIAFSGHKFIGGPGTPGVLVIKKSCLPDTPTVPGGGVVTFVSNEEHRYLPPSAQREEAGTPNILGDIRLGLAMKIKESFGIKWIEEEELKLSDYVYSRLSADPRVYLLGKNGGWKGHHLPIFSFMIRRGQRFLHYNLVALLLNDLFGIQCRGGCSCAGPFVLNILGVTTEKVNVLSSFLTESNQVMEPGQVRLSMTFWTPQVEVDYIIDAVLFIAEHGWKFVRHYKYDFGTAKYEYGNLASTDVKMMSLHAFHVDSKPDLIPTQDFYATWGVHTRPELLKLIQKRVTELVSGLSISIHDIPATAEELTVSDEFRWYVTPYDVEATDVDCTTMPLAGIVVPNDIPMCTTGCFVKKGKTTAKKNMTVGKETHTAFTKMFSCLTTAVKYQPKGHNPNIASHYKNNTHMANPMAKERVPSIPKMEELNK